MSRVLALVAAPTLESAAGTEFLRVLVALRGVGADVLIVEAGAGAGALSGASPALEFEGERYFVALAADDVAPRRAADLAEEIAAADAVVVLPDPARAGHPPVLMLPRHEKPTLRILADVLQAGQIVIGGPLPTAR